MIFLIIFAIAVIIFVLVVSILFPASSQKKYEYKKKDYVMTQSEMKFFTILTQAIGNTYEIFPQVHLASFLDHKIKGQNWNGAFRHIDEKSVDYLLCNKTDLLIRCAIELDDKSHERPDRQERDKEVERILRDAHMPLLRIKDHENIDSGQIVEKINGLLNQKV